MDQLGRVDGRVGGVAPHLEFLKVGESVAVGIAVRPVVAGRVQRIEPVMHLPSVGKPVSVRVGIQRGCAVNEKLGRVGQAVSIGIPVVGIGAVEPHFAAVGDAVAVAVMVRPGVVEARHAVRRYRIHPDHAISLHVQREGVGERPVPGAEVGAGEDVDDIRAQAFVRPGQRQSDGAVGGRADGRELEIRDAAALLAEAHHRGGLPLLCQPRGFDGTRPDVLDQVVLADQQVVAHTDAGGIVAGGQPVPPPLVVGVKRRV